MLVSAFPKLKNTRFVRAVHVFFRSPWYCALIAALMAVSEIFSLEFPVYYLYLALGAACLLFDGDAIGILPIVVCGYMTFSAQNNPGKFPETSLFRRTDRLFELACILTVAVVLLLGRLAVSLIELPKKRCPKLALGFGGLGLSYLLGGFLSGFYAFDTALYGFVQIVSISLFYFFFYYAIDWREVKPQYFAVVFSAVGAGMLAEIVGMYFLPGVIGENGLLNRGALYTGWGVYNNVGCIMAMCMPAPFYFAAQKKFGWLYVILGCVFFLGVVLTQSRGSILSAIAVLVLCGVAALIWAKKREKIGVAVVLGAFVLAVGVGLAVKHDDTNILFSSLFKSGMNDSGRIEIYRSCWQDFLDAPFFGKGFYHTSGYVAFDPGPFIPPRAHNTVFQLLASGGAFAFLMYFWHRFTTVKLCLYHPTAAKMFAFLCVVSLLFTSLLDCNFFNIGPGLLYSVLLVLAEGTDENGDLYREKKKGRRGS